MPYRLNICSRLAHQEKNEKRTPQKLERKPQTPLAHFEKGVCKKVLHETFNM